MIILSLMLLYCRSSSSFAIFTLSLCKSRLLPAMTPVQISLFFDNFHVQLMDWLMVTSLRQLMVIYVLLCNSSAVISMFTVCITLVLLQYPFITIYFTTFPDQQRHRQIIGYIFPSKKSIFFFMLHVIMMFHSCDIQVALILACRCVSTCFMSDEGLRAKTSHHLVSITIKMIGNINQCEDSTLCVSTCVSVQHLIFIFFGCACFFFLFYITHLHPD